MCFMCIEWNFYWRAGGLSIFYWLLDCPSSTIWPERLEIRLVKKFWENLTSILKVMTDAKDEAIKRLVWHTKKKSKLQKLPWLWLWQMKLGRETRKVFKLVLKSAWFLICGQRNGKKMPKIKLNKGNWAAETNAWKQR